MPTTCHYCHHPIHFTKIINGYIVNGGAWLHVAPHGMNTPTRQTCAIRSDSHFFAVPRRSAPAQIGGVQ